MKQMEIRLLMEKKLLIRPCQLYWFIHIWMLCRLTQLKNGIQTRLSRKSATGKFLPVAPTMTKARVLMHAKAFELMVKTNTLPCNVKFMIEGEEEVGSPKPWEMVRRT